MMGASDSTPADREIEAVMEGIGRAEAIQSGEIELRKLARAAIEALDTTDEDTLELTCGMCRGTGRDDETGRGACGWCDGCKDVTVLASDPRLSRPSPEEADQEAEMADQEDDGRQSMAAHEHGLRFDDGEGRCLACAWRVARRERDEARAEVGRLRELLVKASRLLPLERPEKGLDRDWLAAEKAEIRAAVSSPPEEDEDA